MRSTLDQPKTTWICTCGANLFIVLLCPKCKGESAHVVGFQCIACEIIYSTIPENANVDEEFENVVH